jgi:transposase
MLPNKVRGVPRVNDRRFGPYTTCCNRFVRWRRAGVWSRIMEALAAGHDVLPFK